MIGFLISVENRLMLFFFQKCVIDYLQEKHIFWNITLEVIRLSSQTYYVMHYRKHIFLAIDICPFQKTCETFSWD